MNQRNHKLCVRVSLLILTSFACLLWASVLWGEDQTLFVGDQKHLTMGYKVGNISIGDSKVVQVEVIKDRSEVLLIGRGVGVTKLMLWDQQGALRDEMQVFVNPTNVRRTMEELQLIIGSIEGLRFRSVGSQVVLDGEVLTQDDMDRINKVVSGRKDVLNLVKMSKETQRLIDEQNAAAVRTVQLDIKIMEVDRSYLRNLGVQWSGSPVQMNPLSLASKGGPALGTVTGTISLPQLNAITTSGKARMLQNPSIIARSGEKGHLFVGGEIPIKVAQGLGQMSVQYKEFGLKVDFLPQVDQLNNINMSVQIEASRLSGQGGPDTPPGIIKNQIDTKVFVKENETIVLGGLVSNEDSLLVDKVPGLGNVPVFGNVFKSAQFRKSETDLVMFATPHLIRQAGEAGQNVAGETLKNFNQNQELTATDKEAGIPDVQQPPSKKQKKPKKQPKQPPQQQSKPQPPPQ
jgi:pilus assembly protein CpaC